MKLSCVIDTNKERIILNAVKSYIWDGEDITSYMTECCNRYDIRAVSFGLEPDMRINQIKAHFRNYANSLQDKNNFNKFIQSIRFTNNNIKGFNNLMECEGLEEFKSAKELHTFILNNVIPAVNKI